MTDVPPTGVLLVNLGSPDAPTAEAVRRYLDEFLSDPLVVDLPRWLWLPVLRGLVLRRRPAPVAELYRSIWTDAGSPLVVTTRAQAEALGRRLGSGWTVVAAMRYGRPSLDDGLRGLRAAGCERVVVAPLFPQFACATVGSIQARVGELLDAQGWSPSLSVVPPYHADAGFLDALAGSIRAALASDEEDAHLVLSFHGLPMSQVRRGDPYPRQCEQTARDVAARLGRPSDSWSLVYQSRFGPQAWLQPYAVDVVADLARRHRRLVVACPGFAADCLETLEEIGVQLDGTFRAAGGDGLRLAPCLNDAPAFIEALEGLVRSAAAPTIPVRA